jgi:HK97 gp10 family phage protein
MEVDSAEFRDGFRMALNFYKAENRKQLVSTAAKVRDTARQFCAVDTGWLRESVSYRKGEDTIGPFVEIGVIDVPMSATVMKRQAKKLSSSGRSSGKVKSPREYGWYVEFGTIHMPAQPFLRPALAMVIGFMQEGVGYITGRIQGPRQKHLMPRTFTTHGHGG